MIKRKEEMETKVVTRMRDGDGQIIQHHLLSKEDMADHCRLFATMTVKEGCSIGNHSHTGETEYYYILSGEGIVREADKDEIVRAGDLVITGGGASHSIRNNGKEDLVFIAIIILE